MPDDDKCAKTLAMINLADCDDYINQGFSDSFESITTGFDPIFLGVIEQDDDMVVGCARYILGREMMAAIIKKVTHV